MNYISVYRESAVLYLLIMLCTVLFSIIAEKSNKKRNWYLYIVIIILSVFAGIRGKNVGIDVAHYIIRHIEPIKHGLFNQVNQPVGFKAIVWICYRISTETQFVFLVFAVITNFFIIKRFWDFRKDASFSFMVFCYCCTYYLYTFNVFRQYMAIAIVFYSTRFLKDKRYFLFITITCIAMTIHTTAILGFVFVPIDLLLSNSKQNKYKKIFELVMPFIIIIVAFMIYKYYDYEHYIALYNTYSKGSLGLMMPVKFMLCIILYICYKKESTFSLTELKKISLIYMLGIVISFIVIFSVFADRFAWYYLIIEPVLMSAKIKNKNIRLLVRLVCGLICLYVFYINLKLSGQGIMPYQAFWQ